MRVAVSSPHALEAILSLNIYLRYRAPELVCAEKTERASYGCAVDVWSFGCVMFELLVGEPLAPYTTMVQWARRLTTVLGPCPERLPWFAEVEKHTQLNTMEPVWLGNTATARSCLLQALRWDPRLRVPCKSLLEQPWMQACPGVAPLAPLLGKIQATSTASPARALGNKTSKAEGEGMSVDLGAASLAPMQGHQEEKQAETSKPGTPLELFQWSENRGLSERQKC